MSEIIITGPCSVHGAEAFVSNQLSSPDSHIITSHTISAAQLGSTPTIAPIIPDLCAPAFTQMAACTPPLREALNETISTGTGFADTKIVLFSRRDSSGIVCKPKALYASGHVLRTVPYFNDRTPLSNFADDPRE